MSLLCDRWLCRQPATRYIKVGGTIGTVLGDVRDEESGKFCDGHADKLVGQAGHRGWVVIADTRLEGTR